MNWAFFLKLNIMKPTLTKEIAQKMYESNEQSLKDFALLNYPELAKKQLPKSWEELKSVKGWYVEYNSTVVEAKYFESDDEDKNIFATKEQAEASIALAMLSQLREVARDGWKPDWQNEEKKFTIELFRDRLDKSTRTNYCEFLSFQSAEIRDEFLENFRELILTAKPLLS